MAFLRRQAAQDVASPRLGELVDELSRASEPFRRWWGSHDVREKASGVKRFAHPEVGELELNYETLDVAGDVGRSLVVYTARPASASTAALERLRAAKLA